MAENEAQRIGKGCGGIFALGLLGFLMFAIVNSQFSKKNASPTAAEIATFEQGLVDLSSAMRDPEKVKLVECLGIQVYQDPQPAGHPPSPAQCAAILRQGGQTSASTEAVSELLARYQALNSKCRGGSGDDPKTITACEERDKIFAQLRVNGWCWGSEAQAEYQKQWQPCAGSRPVQVSRDPYAVGQKQLENAEYRQSKADLINRVQIAYHAARCRVIQTFEAQLIFSTGINQISRNDIAAGRSDYHPELVPELRTAALEARARADKPGACDYWQQNPEAVSEVRRLGQLATMQ